MSDIDHSLESFEDSPKYEEYLIPEKMLSASVLLLTVLLGELFFPGVVSWFYNGVKDNLVGIALDSLNELLFVGCMIAVHESIHYAVAVARGYDPDIGVRLVNSYWGIKEPSPYIVVLEEFLSRDDNIVMLVFPLLVLDGFAMVGLLPIFPAIVAYYAKIVLVVNTAFSIGDLYNVVRLLRMPPETRFINLQGEDLRTFYTPSD